MLSNSRRMLEAAANNNYADFQHWVYLAHNIDIQNENGITALMFASRNGNIDMVNTLIGYGANLNIQNHRNETALIDAIVYGHAHIMLNLIRRGADVHIISDNSMTAIDHYNQSNNVAIRNVIIRVDNVNQNINNQ